MRLIDADALLERIMDINSWYLYNEWGSETEFHKLIDEAPTVEPTDTDLISRADAMAEFREWVKKANENGETPTWNDAVSLIGSLPSAAAEPKSEQYKKGFEDAKRALELEYARESENMRKRIAGLEVLLNAREAIAEANSVVRCKDCRHRVHDEERGLYYCERYYGQGDVSDENFCQWGERND